MKKLVFGLMCVGFGLLNVYFLQGEKPAEDETTAMLRRAYDDDVFDNRIRAMVNKATTIDELDRAELLLDSLPQANRDRIAPIISLKKSSIWFEEAESYLQKAIEIERAVVPPAQPQVDEYGVPIPPQEERALHPLTVVNLEKAFGLYEMARKESEKLKDRNDVDFNYHSNYLKGEIYYRVLEFMADKESAPELFNQTLTYYKYALKNRPNDINTVVNIELLIKNQNGLTGGANPQARKKQMLNSKKYGVGRSSGN